MRNKYLNLLRDAVSDALFEIEVKDNSKVYPEHILNGQYWPSKAVSMIGIKRLDNIRELLEDVIDKGVPGDFLEAGVWRGGALVYARGVLDCYGCRNRKVIGCDSFQGLPPPDTSKYPLDEGDTLHTVTYLAVSQEEVKNNLVRFGLYDPETVKFVPGFFSESLRGPLPFTQLAVLRLDGDMYSSTIETLDALYDKVSPGGYVIIDDYALPGCHHATNDFLAKRNIKTPLEVIDWSGRYFKKA